MPKEDTIKIDGKVEELLPNMHFQRGLGEWDARDCSSVRKNENAQYSCACRRYRDSRNVSLRFDKSADHLSSKIEVLVNGIKVDFKDWCLNLFALQSILGAFDMLEKIGPR